MKSIGRIVVSAILGLAAVVTRGESVRADQTSPRVSGTVTYRERMALPPTAVLEVSLDDVSRAGGVAPVVAQLRVENPGQVPIKFEMTYNATAIDVRGRYGVRATVSDGSVVLFTSPDTALVLTQGHGSRVDLVLTRVATAKPATAAAPTPPAPGLPPFPFVNLPATYTGTLPCVDCAGDHYQLNLFADDSFFLRVAPAGKPNEPRDDIGSWTVSSDRRVLALRGRSGDVRMFAIATHGTLRQLDATGKPLTTQPPPELARATAFRVFPVRLPMRGAYTSSGTAAEFVECSTGQRWPVAAEAASKALESGYVAAKSGGLPVLAEIEGSVVQRPKGDGTGTQSTLVVEKVARLRPSDSCEPRFTSATLVDTDWRLTHLGDKAVTPVSDPRRVASLTFTPTASTEGGFSASSGCNRMIGTYAVSNGTMALTAGGSMMSCKEKAADEAALVAALKATRAYRVAGRSLELMDAKGARLARFEARQAAGITKR